MQPEYGIDDIEESFNQLKRGKLINPPKTVEERKEYDKQYRKLYRLKMSHGTHRRGPYKKTST